MKLPILAYGQRMLRQKCVDIDAQYPNLQQLIKDMWETMYNANGCGLAAPQIGQPIKLFVVDSKTTYDNLEGDHRQDYFAGGDTGITETFINAKIIGYSGSCWEDREGCLSIPDLSQMVKRHWTITIAYYNQNFQAKTCSFSGLTARMIQHEYDHTEGVLYLDHLKPLTKKLMESRLKRIAKGQVIPKYPMLLLTIHVHMRTSYCTNPNTCLPTKP